ncbi:hypothetical protein ODJ79_37445 [Actinoplanes sp. KI2]|uniref:hypothetical protein n=1 Tax=Actinoplanes sp. KI2 TaxID=2983315 RepID=UPI0021D585FA|nr:hypothetical protein [Actinoplanes sp. KI2]MCU7729434.1 hypothetical protein [Actinoplanes sp. KI2]
MTHRQACAFGSGNLRPRRAAAARRTDEMSGVDQAAEVGSMTASAAQAASLDLRGRTITTFIAYEVTQRLARLAPTSPWK